MLKVWHCWQNFGLVEGIWVGWTKFLDFGWTKENFLNLVEQKFFFLDLVEQKKISNLVEQKKFFKFGWTKIF